MTVQRIAVIGPGRVGLSLARALIRCGVTVRLLGRDRRVLPEPIPAIETNWHSALAASELVIVAVPDDAIADVARSLAGTGAITEHHVVLQTSGLHDRSALAMLDATGAGLGSWHPLQTFGIIAGDAGAFADTPVVVEGDLRAVAAGRALAELLDVRPVVEIPASGKAMYHAAAVFASNYLVVLAEIAARLARDAGVGDAAAGLFLPLMQRTLGNYGAGGADTLTGPIRRGDAGTVARHLAVLTGAERELYVMLGREALRLARAGGLDAEQAIAIERLLTAR